MNFGQFSASLFDYDKIRIVLNNDKYREEKIDIYIKNRKGENVGFVVTDTSFQFKTNIFDLKLDQEIVFGEEYVIFLENFGRVVLNVNNAPQFDGFDERFYTDQKFGSIYSKKETTFRIWAPLATRVVLAIRKTTDIENTFHMLERQEKGLFETTLKGDYLGYSYTYLVTNNGYELEASDPYAFTSLANNKASVVIDMDSFKIDFHDDKLEKITSPTELIIYETSVRDMSIDERTNIINKGTFAGLIEKGRSTKYGNKVGFDYIEALGINMLQLMPIYDFVTVDETNPKKGYNWGYDPGQYFAPEGSYATDVNNPVLRVKELMELVSEYHKINVRISMDVVFNHVYEYSTHTLEKVVPNYYFRKDNHGRVANGSGCGNDLATERKMVSRMVKDAALHFIKHYHIDAFRFDLVGLIDQKTIKSIYDEAILIRPDFIMYGEGWNMMTTVDKSLLTNMDNAFATPYIGFFNDAYREIAKGGSFSNNIYNNGYLLGNPNFRDGFKWAFKGSVTNHTFTPKFIDARQSINYIECHDNGTLIDKLIANFGDEDYQNNLRILQLSNTMLMLSHGVPFFHRGQEIGLSKYGDMNSYRSSDKVNQFTYCLAYKRRGLVSYFSDLTKLRKECKFLTKYQAEEIEKQVEFKDLPSGGLLISFKNTESLSPYKIFDIYVNISKESLNISLDSPLKVILNQSGYVGGLFEESVQHILIPKQSVLIVGLRKE